MKVHKKSFVELLSIFILLPLFTGVVYSASQNVENNCPEIRLDEDGGPFKKIPVYDQKRFSKSDTNICYSVVAAELADANRFFRGDHALIQLTSPLSVALNFKTSPDPLVQLIQDRTGGTNIQRILGLGDTEIALRSSAGRAVCDQRWLERYASLIDGLKRKASIRYSFGSWSPSIENFLGSILDVIENYKKQQAQFHEWLSDQQQRDLFECVEGEFFRKRRALGFGNINEILIAVQHAADAEDPAGAAKNFLETLCQGHSFVLDLPDHRGFTGRTAEASQDTKRLWDLFSKITSESVAEEEIASLRDEIKAISAREVSHNDEAVAARRNKVAELLSGLKPVPIGIAYDPGVLNKRPTGTGFSHRSIIIGGRKGKSGVCELLVRDSYGPSCVNADHKPRYSYPCENGSVWVPAGELMKSTQSLFWLERP